MIASTFCKKVNPWTWQDASLEDVVKLGVFLVDIGKLQDYSALQSEFFKGKMPAQTVVEVRSLALPGMMVEVEAIAVV
jgi:enamine deaminase RidA (YjgF/YER057c/UK114 family)